jgi:hypothetical protein
LTKKNNLKNSEESFGINKNFGRTGYQAEVLQEMGHYL